MPRHNSSSACRHRQQLQLLPLLLALAVSTAHFAAASISVDSLSHEQLQQYILDLHRNSTVLDAQLLQDPNLPSSSSSSSSGSSSGRQLLAMQAQQWAMYQQQGRYAVIKNPSMPGEVSRLCRRSAAAATGNWLLLYNRSTERQAAAVSSMSDNGSGMAAAAM
jgi:hypothetical protein